MIQIDIQKCTGCKMCETACAFYHSGKINRNMSRIRVINLYQTGIDGPVTCIQCKERACMACPVQAMTIGQFGQVIISPTICIKCKKCEQNCPIGAIEIFNEIVYVCDLCGGSPKCIDVCSEGAISYIQEKSDETSLAGIMKVTKKMNPSERRTYYINTLGEELRKKWKGKHA